MNDKTPENIDEYIADFSPETQIILREIRATIKNAAPGAIETISYKMPAFKLNGKPLVYFAAYKNHVGFYALPTGHARFAESLSKYKQGKGSVRFPLSEPLPFDLIAEMVRFRAEKKSRRGNIRPSADRLSGVGVD